MLTFIFGVVVGAIALFALIKTEQMVRRALRQHKYDQRERVVKELRREGWFVQPNTW